LRQREVASQQEVTPVVFEQDSDIVWVVVEQSPVGSTVVGTYEALDQAREAVTSLSKGQISLLENYRIEGHVLGRGKVESVPWHVELAADGEVLGAAPLVFCSCEDDDAQFRKRSFIATGGQQMSIVVLARTPGHAIFAAEEYRAWLRDNGRWVDEGAMLEPIEAS
jgi:hypothetical protein